MKSVRQKKKLKQSKKHSKKKRKSRSRSIRRKKRRSRSVRKMRKRSIKKRQLDGVLDEKTIDESVLKKCGVDFSILIDMLNPSNGKENTEIIEYVHYLLYDIMSGREKDCYKLICETLIKIVTEIEIDRTFINELCMKICENLVDEMEKTRTGTGKYEFCEKKVKEIVNFCTDNKNLVNFFLVSIVVRFSKAKDKKLENAQLELEIETLRSIIDSLDLLSLKFFIFTIKNINKGETRNNLIENYLSELITLAKYCFEFTNVDLSNFIQFVQKYRNKTDVKDIENDTRLITNQCLHDFITNAFVKYGDENLIDSDHWVSLSIILILLQEIILTEDKYILKEINSIQTLLQTLLDLLRTLKFNVDTFKKEKSLENGQKVYTSCFYFLNNYILYFDMKNFSTFRNYIDNDEILFKTVESIPKLRNDDDRYKRLSLIRKCCEMFEPKLFRGIKNISIKNFLSSKHENDDFILDEISTIVNYANVENTDKINDKYKNVVFQLKWLKKETIVEAKNMRINIFLKSIIESKYTFMNFDKLLQELENIINLEKFENKKMYLVCLADFITSVFIGSKSYIDKYEYLKIRFNKIRDELLETARNSNKSKKEKEKEIGLIKSITYNEIDPKSEKKLLEEEEKKRKAKELSEEKKRKAKELSEEKERKEKELSEEKKRKAKELSEEKKRLAKELSEEKKRRAKELSEKRKMEEIKIEEEKIRKKNELIEKQMIEEKMRKESENEKRIQQIKIYDENKQNLKKNIKNYSTPDYLTSLVKLGLPGEFIKNFGIEIIRNINNVDKKQQVMKSTIFYAFFPFILYYIGLISSFMIENDICQIVIGGGTATKFYVFEYETLDIDLKIFPLTNFNFEEVSDIFKSVQETLLENQVQINQVFVDYLRSIPLILKLEIYKRFSETPLNLFDNPSDKIWDITLKSEKDQDLLFLNCMSHYNTHETDLSITSVNYNMLDIKIYNKEDEKYNNTINDTYKLLLNSKKDDIIENPYRSIEFLDKKGFLIIPQKEIRMCELILMSDKDNIKNYITTTRGVLVSGVVDKYINNRLSSSGKQLKKYSGEDINIHKFRDVVYTGSQMKNFRHRIIGQKKSIILTK